MISGANTGSVAAHKLLLLLKTHTLSRHTFGETIRAQSSRNHKDACRIICPGSLSLFADQLVMPLDSDDSCVSVCVSLSPTHTATLGAVETLRNGRGAAGYRLPVTHDLADCGSSAHH